MKYFSMKFLVTFALVCGLTRGQNSSSTLVQIPQEWTYLLPQPFNSTFVYSWLNSTTTGNATIDKTLKKASQSRFVSYSDEFSQMVGAIGSANITNIQCPPAVPECAFEAGVWLPDTNEVWFSYLGFDYPYNQTITSFDLDRRTTRSINTNPPIRYPLGGYYWEGRVYFSEQGLPTQPATVISIDPKTLHVEPIVNSFFGIPLAPSDDIVVTRVKGREYIFFTTADIRAILGDRFPRQQFDTAIWRFDTQSKLLTPAISNTDMNAPNGIRVSPDGKKLYVTNTPFTAASEWELQASNTSESNAIYLYDLNEEGMPVNRRLFGLERTGFSNGLHIDNKGRVWTADNDGINVRSPDGRILGLFNYQPFHDPDVPVIGNFALAGNKLVIGGLTEAIVYELSEALVTPGNRITN